MTDAAPLLDLVSVVGGGTPSRAEPSYWGGEILWATVKDLSGRTLSTTAERITHSGLQASASKVVPEGSVILATRIVPGKAALATRSLAINQDLKALIPRGPVDSRYLLYFLDWIAPRLEQKASGSTVKGITLDTLSRVRVPLPPLAEQRRIAAVLDKTDGIRRKRRESLRLLDEFLRSAFLEMFGDPVTNEKRWKRFAAGSAIAKIEPGSSVKGEDKPRSPGEWAVLKISAVTSGWYLPAECKVVPAPPNRPVAPRRGDLLFSRANTRELVAATCLVDHDVPRLFLPDKLWRLTPTPGVASAEYLRFLLADPRFRSTLTRHATGTSGSMLNVSQEKLLRLALPLPPLPLQQRFAAVVWSTYRLRDRIQEAGYEYGPLFDSVAQQAFRGGTVGRAIAMSDI